jgi:hypothetical protein
VNNESNLLRSNHYDDPHLGPVHFSNITLNPRKKTP